MHLNIGEACQTPRKSRDFHTIKIKGGSAEIELRKNDIVLRISSSGKFICQLFRACQIATTVYTFRITRIVDNRIMDVRALTILANCSALYFKKFEIVPKKRRLSAFVGSLRNIIRNK